MLAALLTDATEDLRVLFSQVFDFIVRVIIKNALKRFAFCVSCSFDSEFEFRRRISKA